MPPRGGHLLFGFIKTVSKLYLKRPLGLSVERRADSPGYWKLRKRETGSMVWKETSRAQGRCATRLRYAPTSYLIDSKLLF